MTDIAVLFSGRGTNLRAIIDRSLESDSAYQVKAVITDNPKAEGIQIAHEKNILTYVVPEPQFEWRVIRILNDLSVSLVVLAGFMRILGIPFCSRWEGKCINIHPSLLPKYKGLNTHRRALVNGDTETGCSVHYVTSDLDSGPIIAQARVPIEDDDGESSLTIKVLKEENRLLPKVIQMLASGRIVLFGKDEIRLIGSHTVLNEPLTMDDLQ